jgi:hypothetical protein
VGGGHVGGELPAGPFGLFLERDQLVRETAGPRAAPLLVLAAYALVFGFPARRFFRWE